MMMHQRVKSPLRDNLGEIVRVVGFLIIAAVLLLLALAFIGILLDRYVYIRTGVS